MSTARGDGRKLRDGTVAVLVCVATLLLYVQVLGLGAVALDDPRYVTNNPVVQRGLSVAGVQWAFSDLSTVSNYHPVTWMSHMIDVQLFGMNLAGHHAVSALLHGMAAGLVFLLGARLLRHRGSAVVVALAFAAHPQRVESVAWLSERKDVLSGVFFLGMLLAYVVGHQDRRPFLRVLSVVLFVFGLLSKPMLVTAPAVLLLLDAGFLGRFTPGQRLRVVVEKAPLFAASLLLSWATVMAQQGAMAPLSALTPSMRLVNASSSLARYLELFFVPVDLSPLYTMRMSELTPGHAVVPVVVLLAVSGLAVAAARRGVAAPLVGWSWFLGMLVPVVGIVQVGSQSMADRYTYLPHLGLLFGLAGAAVLVRAAGARRLMAICSFVWIAMLAVFTWLQIPVWQSQESLFRWALQVNPEDPIANGVVAGFDLDAGDVDAAIAHGEVAAAGATVSNAREVLAVAYLRAGRVDEAEAVVRGLLRDAPRGLTWRLLGDVERLRGAPARALQRYEIAAQEGEDVVFEQACVQLDLGQVETAVAALEHLMARGGDDSEVKLELARARQLQGDSAAARALLDDVRAAGLRRHDAALVARADAALRGLAP